MSQKVSSSSSLFLSFSSLEALLGMGSDRGGGGACDVRPIWMSRPATFPTRQARASWLACDPWLILSASWMMTDDQGGGKSHRELYIMPGLT